jgi:hypothetical protein
VSAAAFVALTSALVLALAGTVVLRLQLAAPQLGERAGRRGR